MATKEKNKSKDRNKKVKDKSSSKEKASKSSFALSVKVPGEVARIEGSTKLVEQGIRVNRKRSRSPKVDTFIIPIEDAIAYCIGENGWIMTSDPEFLEPMLELELTEGKVEEGTISGKDDSGQQVVINRNLIDTTHKFTSYAD